MKTFLKKIIVAFLCIGTGVYAQSFKFGTIAADAGFGFGLYGVRAHSPINGQDVSGIAAVGTLPSVDAEFGVLKFLGIGGHYRRGTYGPYSTGKIRGTDLCLMVNFHLANNNDKFDLPIGIGYGFSSMKTPETTVDRLVTKGNIIRFHVSPHLYFGKYVGMFFRVAYNKHLLSKNLQIRDGSGRVWTEADGATWNMGGLEFNLGVAFKIQVLDKEEKKSE
jgi:hypothetical protein